jgi:hypothetical protein
MSLRTTRFLIVPVTQVTTSLPVPFYNQQQSMWCWAACIEMVVVHYNTAAVQQCDIVNFAVARTDCCINPTSGWCNTGIPTALYAGIYNHFGVDQILAFGGASTFAGVQTNINANRVLEVQLNWTAGGAHVVLVVGWSSDGGNFVQVNDPGYGSMWITYAALLYGYGMGTWVQTWAVWE